MNEKSNLICIFKRKINSVFKKTSQGPIAWVQSQWQRRQDSLVSSLNALSPFRFLFTLFVLVFCLFVCMFVFYGTLHLVNVRTKWLLHKFFNDWCNCSYTRYLGRWLESNPGLKDYLNWLTPQIKNTFEQVFKTSSANRLKNSLFRRSI